MICAGCPDDSAGDPVGETGAAGSSSGTASASGTTGDPPVPASSSGGASEGTTAAPVTCEAAVMLSDPACDECVASNCCAQLEACFGADGGTPCAALHGCVYESCFEIEGQEEFDACIEETCEPTPEDLESWFDAVGCTADCLAISPGNEETCEIMPE